MNTDADMWVQFAKSFGVLFAVLAIFLLALYLVRRFSGRFGTKGSESLIKVLSVHHLSPKEKLVLVSVLEESVLLGVSPAGISSLARFDTVPKTVSDPPQTTPGFQAMLKKSLNNSSRADKSPLENKPSGPGKGENL